jgi:uncharacterized membrane protein
VKPAIAIIAMALFTTGTIQAQSNATCTSHLFKLPSPTVNTLSNGINKFGTTVGEADQPPAGAGSVKAFIRFSNGGSTLFSAPGSSFTILMRRNSAGVSVGSFSRAGHSHGFALHNSTFQQIDFPGATNTFVTGINAAGTIVGTYLDPNAVGHAFKLQNKKFTKITPPGAVQSFAGGINDNGAIVGSFNKTGNGGFGVLQGFRLQGGVFTTFRSPSGGPTALNDISNTGEIVGRDTATEAGQAFMLKNGVFKFISIPGAEQTQANGINSSNVIAGAALFSDGWHGFTATCK